MRRSPDDLPLWKLVALNILLRCHEWKARNTWLSPFRFVECCRKQWEIEKPHLEDWP